MADFDRNVLSHYNIPSAYPTQWPAELDDSEDETAGSAGGVRRSRSRYSALERSASDRRSMIPGSQKTGDGRANLVQKDEPDPLGGVSSVAQSLKQRGLPIEQDVRLRNKFMLSSTTFSPALFLSQTHPNATTEELLRGLDYLSKSIDQKSASLKVLVESNFERFVRAKATIDNVYTEMRNQGVEPESQTEGLLGARHSRQVSRSSGHYRNFSSGSAAGMAPSSGSTYSKNALRKETEYGVQGIKGPLLEVSQRADDVWGPALGGREREASLKAVADAIEKDRALYELGANLNRSIKQKDYEKIVEQYNAARTYANQARVIGERALQSGQALTDDQIHRVLVTGRMWSDVEEQIKGLKRDIWRRLSNNHAALPLPGASQAEEHMELIEVLLELGVDDNPIWIWLLGRYDALKNKITAVVDRSKVEIEIMRRRVAAAEKPSPQIAATYLRQAAKNDPDALDSDHVLEFWEAISTYLTKLLSLSSGLLGEVVDFWDSAKSFIDGQKQKTLPMGFEGQSRKHHRLSDDGVRDLSNGTIELVNLVREAVFSLFANPPTEDISSLFSPTTANTPKTPMSAVFSPTNGQLGRLDLNNVPASPKGGEAWEDFAFWPPYANSLSAGHYLGKILLLVGTAAGEMATLGPVGNSSTTFDSIKNMISGARERCMRAVCDAWGKDAENCKYLEDWTRSPDKPDQTRMPTYFAAFEKTALNGMQHILYFTEAIIKPEATRGIVTPPSSKLLQMARTQFVSSVYKVLTGMLEIAEKSPSTEGDEWVMVTAAMVSAAFDDSSSKTSIASSSIDASSRNVRMLLTLSNLKALRIDHVPQLIALFESSFSVKLTEESKTIRDVFGQIDHKLFQSYTRPTIASLTKTIKDGINAPGWVPNTTRPDQVKPYVYAAMMTLVVVHTEVSTTVSSSDSANSGLLTQTLSHLLENVSQALLEGFKERKGTYSLPALMQATLDTEFIAHTMSQYATPKAGEIQSQIYMELDKRTNNDSRARLQQELGDMRIVLKKLREGSRGSFGCFKRQRTNEKDRGRPERKATG